MDELYFDESVIILDMEGTEREEILSKMGRNLVDHALVKESFINAIIKREAQFPTGLPTAGVSVAIPHTDAEHVNQKALSLGLLKNPVDFGVMGDEHQTTPVKLVFMLAMDEPHAQLSLLQTLMGIFQDEGTLKYLVNEKNKQSIKKLLEEKLDFPALRGGE